MIPVLDTRDGASFRVRVQPRARRDAVVGEVGDALKLALAAPPVDGRANEALVALLARLLDVPVARVRIASGATGRSKRIAVEGLAAETVRARLARVIPER